MGRGRPVSQWGREPYELVPLFTNERGIHRAADDLIKVAIMLGAIQLVEELLTHVKPGHQGKPQEMTEAKQLIGKPMLVHKMFLGAQDGIVVEQAIYRRSEKDS